MIEHELGPLSNRDQIPYVEQYFGVWAIRQEEFVGHLNWLQNLDFTAHMNGPVAAAARTQRSVPQMATDVAVLQISGSLMKQRSSMGANTSTVEARQIIRELVRDEAIAAIVLHIDSPGGTAAGTKELADEVAKADQSKPVLAFIDDLGASAAYWVASQAREVYSNATGLVGSIGTYGVVYDMSELAAKEGIKVHVIRAGEFKGAGVRGTPITDAQLQEVQRTVDGLNAFFIAAVAAGRGIGQERAQELADGRVHIGADAARLGLIDGVSTLEATIERAAQLSASNSPSTRAAAAGSVVSLTKETGTMSETQQAEKPKAATHAEIRAACTGCTADFVLEQLERNATIEQSKEAWAKAQAEAKDNEIAELRAKVEESEKQLKATREQAEQKAKGLGLARRGAPVVSTTSEDAVVVRATAGSAKAEWKALMARKRAEGVATEKALHQIDQEYPGLREQMIAEDNAAA